MNPRTLQHAEAESAARAVSLAAQTLAGAATVRAGRLRPRMLAAFCRRLDRNHNALLLLNSANRWLSLALVNEYFKYLLITKFSSQRFVYVLD